MNEQQSPTFSGPQPTIIVNHTPITFDCLWTFNAHVARIKRRTINNIIWTVLWSILLTVWIILAVIRPSSTAMIALLVCGVAICGHGYLLIFMNVILKRQIKKHPHVGGQYTFTFDADQFIEEFNARDTRSQSCTLYSALLKVEENDAYLYLFNQPNTAFLISKNGFLQGSAEELKTLLRRSLPAEKIKFQ